MTLAVLLDLDFGKIKTGEQYPADVIRQKGTRNLADSHTK